jgi:hypothetical protein
LVKFSAKTHNFYPCLLQNVFSRHEILKLCELSHADEEPLSVIITDLLRRNRLDLMHAHDAGIGTVVSFVEKHTIPTKSSSPAGIKQGATTRRSVSTCITGLT